eukprot:s1638_g6.t2
MLIVSSLRDLASKLAFGTSEPAETNKIQQALHILAQENMAPVSKPSSSSAQTFQGEAKSNSARVCLAWVLACLLLLAAGWSFSSECVDSEDGPGSATAEAAMAYPRLCRPGIRIGRSSRSLLQARPTSDDLSDKCRQGRGGACAT